MPMRWATPVWRVVEKSVNLDVGAHWKAGAHTFSLTAFSKPL